jgi:hypothetical protein
MIFIRAPLIAFARINAADGFAAGWSAGAGPATLGKISMACFEDFSLRVINRRVLTSLISVDLRA